MRRTQKEPIGPPDFACVSKKIKFPLKTTIFFSPVPVPRMGLSDEQWDLLCSIPNPVGRALPRAALRVDHPDSAPPAHDEIQEECFIVSEIAGGRLDGEKIAETQDINPAEEGGMPGPGSFPDFHKGGSIRKNRL